MKRRFHALEGSSGQSLVEFAVVLPLVLMIVLGVVEVGFALLDQQVVTKLTREGSNLISRDTSLLDATTALRATASRPVNLDNGSSKLILSVLMKGATTGSANYNKMILYQRYVYGSYPGTSKLVTAGSGSFGAAPDYVAVNSGTNTGLQVTNVPANLVQSPGGMVYVTELYTRHTLITPLNNIGITLPQTLYSIAYF
jgi:Flp pilus assembly protein TadG